MDTETARHSIIERMVKACIVARLEDARHDADVRLVGRISTEQAASLALQAVGALQEEYPEAAEVVSLLATGIARTEHQMRSQALAFPSRVAQLPDGNAEILERFCDEEAMRVRGKRSQDKERLRAEHTRIRDALRYIGDSRTRTNDERARVVAVLNEGAECLLPASLPTPKPPTWAQWSQWRALSEAERGRQIADKTHLAQSCFDWNESGFNGWENLGQRQVVVATAKKRPSKPGCGWEFSHVSSRDSAQLWSERVKESEKLALAHVRENLPTPTTGAVEDKVLLEAMRCLTAPKAPPKSSKKKDKEQWSVIQEQNRRRSAAGLAPVKPLTLVEEAKAVRPVLSALELWPDGDKDGCAVRKVSDGLRESRARRSEYFAQLKSIESRPIDRSHPNAHARGHEITTTEIKERPEVASA